MYGYQLQSMNRISTQPISLTWNKLSASVQDKEILCQSTGYCRPGDLLAIMGPSGSGKTTMLSLLTYKYDKQLRVTGEVLANNKDYDRNSYYHFGSYVYQNDVLYPTFTVRQTLTFIAKLKFKTIQQANKRVGELISEFELQKCADHLIGTEESKGISGGEKKRVCIATQMVSKPSLLILDQPTSGLDSNKAARVLKVLKRLAKEGHSIIFTIHQPSYLLYSLLNRVIVLSKGHTIYQGQASQISLYLQELGITLSQKSTICDFFMLQISEYKKIKDGYSTPFNIQNYHKYVEGNIQSEMSSQQLSNIGYQDRPPMHTFWKMFTTLLMREWTNYKRNPMKLTRLVMNFIIMAGFISLVFFNSISTVSQIEAATAQTVVPAQIKQIIVSKFIQAQTSSYINVMSTMIVSISFVVLGLPLQRPIFYKEQSSKLYSAFAYFITKIFIETACLSLGTILYSSIVYWVLGYDKDPLKYLFFVLTILGLTFIGNSFGFFIGSLFKDPRRASALTSLLLLPMSMLSGLWNKLNYIPAWIGWLQYISPFRYALHMMLQNQYGDYVFTKGIIIYDYRADLDITSSWSQNLIIILSLAIVFYFFAYLLLIMRARQISA